MMNAGQNFLEGIVKSKGFEQFELVTFCEEPRPAYDRVHLSEYFTGKTAEDLSMVQPGFFDNHGITIHIGDKAETIDRDRKVVISEHGVEISYDKLVLATGSYPFVPPIPGHNSDRCFVYRTIEDLEAITKTGKDGKVGVVVGGGLLGLEAANALKNLGLETHVVEFSPRLMAVQLDEPGGSMLQRKIESLGVHVHTATNTKGVIDGKEHFHQ